MVATSIAIEKGRPNVHTKPQPVYQQVAWSNDVKNGGKPMKGL